MSYPYFIRIMSFEVEFLLPKDELNLHRTGTLYELKVLNKFNVYKTYNKVMIVKYIWDR